jgi:hypothetical protein
MSDNGYIRIKRKEALEILRADPNAFLLLMLQSLESRWGNEQNPNNLQIGESLIGKKSIQALFGWREQQFREVKKRNAHRYKKATYVGTHQGTIAKLVDNSFCVIHPEESNAHNNAHNNAQKNSEQRLNNAPTTHQQRLTKKLRTKTTTSVSKTKVFSTPPPSPMGGRVAAGGGSGGGGGGGGRKKAYTYPGEISERARAANALTLAERMPISADLFQKWLDEYGTEAVRLELEGTIGEIRSGKRITSPPAYMARRLINNHEPREAKIYDINSIAP